MYKLFHHLQTFSVYFFVVFILPLCWLPLLIYQSIVILIVRLTKPDYGKLFNPVDYLLEEKVLNKKGNVPNSTIVNSITLEGYISLEELKDLFRRNVLEKLITTSCHSNNNTCSNNSNNNNDSGKVRYPELKQYPVSFMGYTFWKTDYNFKIEDHFVEMSFEKEQQQSLSLLHQSMLNKSFMPRRSPWEIILINGYRGDSDNDNGDGNHDQFNPNDEKYAKNKAFIIARFHHSMADARSILKLFVDCLGEKPLKTAEPQKRKWTFRFHDLLMMPINYAKIIALVWNFVIGYWVHPWKHDRSNRDITYALPHLVRMSPKLSLKDVKKIGANSGGTAASAILAVISGSINRVRPDLGKMFATYILPKENHPETLRNHAGFGGLILPCDKSLPDQRLKECHEAFQELKSLNMDKYLECPLSAISTIFSPLRDAVERELLSGSPIGVTNIAGEADGFSVGKLECSEFIFSVGTLAGDIGVVFCISSYKEHLRIAVISSGDILTEVEADKLAFAMRNELETLRSLYC